MAFYCNEHRFYSRMAEEKDVHVPQPTYTIGYCNEQRAYSRFAEQEEVVKVEKVSPPTTTISMCNEQRVFVAEWESIQEHPVYGEIVPALAAFCNEHRSFSRFAEEVAVVNHNIASSPVEICNEQRAYSRIAEEVVFSQRIFESSAVVSTCNEGRAFSRISEEVSVSLASEVFEPVTPVSVCGEHRSFHSFELSAPSSVPQSFPSSFCNEHRAFSTAFSSENIHVYETNTSVPVSVSLCNEHRDVPYVLRETYTEECPVEAGVPACSEHRAYVHAVVKSADEPEVVATHVSDVCVGPFAASAAPEDCVSKFFAGEKVSTGLRQSDSLKDSFVWFAVVAKSSGTLVHVRFLDHLKRHPAVVETHGLASAGSSVKVSQVLAVVRLTADTVEEVLEYSDALLHTVALPLTGAKGVYNGSVGVKGDVALTV